MLKCMGQLSHLVNKTFLMALFYYIAAMGILRTTEWEMGNLAASQTGRATAIVPKGKLPGVPKSSKNQDQSSSGD